MSKTKALALAAGDLHIRADAPSCRRDEDFRAVQRGKLEFLISMSNDREVPLLLPGDVFHKADSKIPPDLLREVIGIFKKAEHGVYVVCGQHDLAFHSEDYYRHSGVAVLEAAGCVRTIGLMKEKSPAFEFEDFVLYGMPYGHDWRDGSFHRGGRDGKTVVAMQHRMVWDSSRPFLQVGDLSNVRMLAPKFAGCHYVVTGDNHEYVNKMFAGIHFLNMGCLTRQTVAERGHTPRIALLTSRGSPEIIEVPHNELAIGDVTVEEQIGGDDLTSLNDFMDSIKAPVEDAPSFIKAFEAWRPRNSFQRDVKQFVVDIMEDIRNGK